MKWYKLIVISLLSGLLLSLSWYPHGLPFISFFALIPMLFVSDALLAKGSKVAFWKGFIFSYPGFVLWNAITTYWICYCTIPGGIAAVVMNAMLQAIIFGLWHCCRKRIEQKWIHPILFAAFWMSFEYLHLNWDLTWPWLNLGNVFAVCPHFVQWYSITGVMGGSLWIIITNFLLYYLILNFRKEKKKAWMMGACAFLLILVPMIISAVQLKHFEKNIDKSTPVEVVVVQPNTDVWTEEYSLSNYSQAERILDISAPLIDEKTNLVVCPESCIPHTVSMLQIERNQWPGTTSLYGGFALIDSAIALHPNLNFILGLSTYQAFDHKASPTAQKVAEHFYVDQYNTSICYNKQQYNGHHHKSRLVPGVEALPFPEVFGFLGDLLIDLGGSSTSLGKDNGYRVFPIQVNGKEINVCTPICYESIYGELTSQFVKNGANIITVITNDSWWNDSPGHTQHFEMARLRAIENRRYVVRSANGGTSAIISPMGDIIKKTKYMERTAFKDTVYAQSEQTFYTKHGDYLAWIAIVFSGILLIYTIEEGIRKRLLKKNQNSSNQNFKP